MGTLFSAQPEEIANLDPHRAVTFFAELIWAELSRAHIPLDNANISFRENVPDGGIDASVVIPDGCSSNFIPNGETKFQIKSGANFKLTKSEIKKELFENKPIAKVNLGESVRRCMEKDGTYCLVSTVHDLNEMENAEVEKLFVDFFEECDYKNAKVKIISRNNLISFINNFPSLCLKLNGRSLSCKTFRSWSEFADMRKFFSASEEISKKIESIRNSLRYSSKSVNIRVIGESGVGKSRLILEALRVADISPLVVYAENPEMVNNQPLEAELIREDSQLHIILVVDECDKFSWESMWNKFEYASPRIKLVTIYNNEAEKESQFSAEYISLNPLPEENVTNILESYGVPSNDIAHWSSFIEGSPRFAHALGQSLIDSPEDPLRGCDFYDRIIAGRDTLDSDNFRRKKIVLKYLSLFRRFGFSSSVKKEGEIIAEIIQDNHPEITYAVFTQIVESLKAQKILQGTNTLYITPRALHIRLWADWWDDYKESFDSEDFLRKINGIGKLPHWFYEMFKYGAVFPKVAEIVKEFLSDEGFFLKNKALIETEAGADFFSALVEADNISGLECLKKIMNEWAPDKCKRFVVGRRQLIWSLEKMAMWKETFEGSAKLLLKLAEGENESYDNNSSGVFSDLFSLGPGRVAPTETDPRDRLPLLEEAITSNSPETRKLVLAGYNKALETRNFVRFGGAEYQGLKQPPKLWVPKTHEDWVDALKTTLSSFILIAKHLNSEETNEYYKILLEHVRSLIVYVPQEVLKLLESLSEKLTLQKEVLKRLVDIIYYDGAGMDPTVLKQCEDLKEKIEGTGFSSELKRYVGMDLIEDRYTRGGKANIEAEKRMKRLATTALKDGDFVEELDWLVTDTAENGFIFGYELGKQDDEQEILDAILDKQRKVEKVTNFFFLGGYLKAIFERDAKVWEKVIQQFSNDAYFAPNVPLLALRSGMTDKVGLIVLDLAQKGTIKEEDFGYFIYGGVIESLSESVFTKLAKYLQGQGYKSAFILIQLFDYYYKRQKGSKILPKELTFDVLTNKHFFTKGDRDNGVYHIDHHWYEIAKEFVNQYPDMALLLAEVCFEKFGEDGTIVDDSNHYSINILTEIAREHPGEIWKMAENYLVSPEDGRAFAIRHWIQDRIAIFPQEKIWEWVDKEKEKRSVYLASFVPNIIIASSESGNITRELLVRYGDNEDVRRVLNANFYTEGWSGPQSLHYKSRKSEIEKILITEKDKNVISWCKDFINSLEFDIQRAERREERDDF